MVAYEPRECITFEREYRQRTEDWRMFFLRVPDRCWIDTDLFGSGHPSLASVEWEDPGKTRGTVTFNAANGTAVYALELVTVDAQHHGTIQLYDAVNTSWVYDSGWEKENKEN